MTNPDLSPEAAEVLQIESPEPSVKVETVGPVRVQSLPRVSAGIRGVTVGGTPRQLLTADPHRAGATVFVGSSDTIGLLIGGSAQEVAGGQPGMLPAGMQLVFSATDELWAASDTPDGEAVTVTVIQERWADGL